MSEPKPNSSPETSEVILKTEDDGAGGLRLVLDGRLDAFSTAKVWENTFTILRKKPPRRLTLDLAEVDYIDISGISYIIEVTEYQDRSGGELVLEGIKEEFQRLYKLFDPEKLKDRTPSSGPQLKLATEVGQASYQMLKDGVELISFVGETAVGLTQAVLRPAQVRWKDTFRVAETTGVNALPIVVLISFLVGLIMAFQAAIPMRLFGATIFVANLIGLSMVRELGPLMTAIVLAGRSGSAFAAEIGTMKVNEEINALTTMGLEPVRFLVVPRVLAAVAMTPLLTIFADLVGVIGGSIVLVSMGFPLVTYYNQVLSAISYGDFIGGLVKSFVFGVLIAGIGCLRGLQTGTGASAVGDSTTRAVVSGIISIVVTDGVFAVVYYYLGL